MEWTKASIETTSTFGVEIVSAMLQQCGIFSIEIIDELDRVRFFKESTRNWDYADDALMHASSDKAHIIFYVTKDEDGEALLNDVERTLAQVSDAQLGSLAIRKENANDETWLNEWKKHFNPIHIGRIVIVPEWIEYQAASSEVVFRIDPGAAFGTGQHQTTQLCIDAIQQHIQPGNSMFDIGCGSGILSIIALLLGANFVSAIDIDPAGAIASTKRNAELNKIDLSKLSIFAGDVITDSDIREATKHPSGAGYDIVAANIVADVIIPLAPIVHHFIKPNGLFIASGIIDDRLEDVLQAFENSNFTVIHTTNLEGWNSIVGKHEGAHA